MPGTNPPTSSLPLPEPIFSEQLSAAPVPQFASYKAYPRAPFPDGEVANLALLKLMRTALVLAAKLYQISSSV